MAEKRKPAAVILLKKRGKKTQKLEIYKAYEFVDDTFRVRNMYRLRVNGKWFGGRKKRFYYKSDIRNMFFKGLEF